MDIADRTGSSVDRVHRTGRPNRVNRSERADRTDRVDRIERQDRTKCACSSDETPNSTDKAHIRKKVCIAYKEICAESIPHTEKAEQVEQMEQAEDKRIEQRERTDSRNSANSADRADTVNKHRSIEVQKVRTEQTVQA